MTIFLDVFTPFAAETLLNLYGIDDSKRRADIIEYSGRLPVLMTWLASSGTQKEGGESTWLAASLVDRFLRWVTDPALRQVALLGALPQTFTKEIMQILLQEQPQTADTLAAYQWLRTMPFVRSGRTGLQYHSVVRRMFLRYLRITDFQTYRRGHETLANFYDHKRSALGLTTESQWIDERWREYTLSYIYHFLAADPFKHWSTVLGLLARAIRNSGVFADELGDLLNQEDVQDVLSEDQKTAAQLLNLQLRAITDGDLSKSFELFNALCNTIDPSDEARGFALAYRGEYYRLDEQWERALTDFENALHYFPQDAWAIARRGETYRLLGRYQEALADLDRAITLDEKNAWAIARRGETYRLLGRYQA